MIDHEDIDETPCMGVLCVVEGSHTRSECRPDGDCIGAECVAGGDNHTRSECVTVGDMQAYEEECKLADIREREWENPRATLTLLSAILWSPVPCTGQARLRRCLAALEGIEPHLVDEP